MKKTAIWMAAVALSAGAAWGATAAEDAVPRAIVYQGVLSDPVEGPLSGTQKASFRVFKDASGGDPLWSKDLDVWCGTGGLFHAWLEGGDELVDAFSEPERLLELQVEGHGEAIAPRVEFTSVPQALLARWARQSPLAFPVLGALSAGEAVEVADAAKFGGGASFGELSASGDLAWTDANAPMQVSGTVTAARFEGDGIPPVGSIAMWMDAEHLPPGWALCNGDTVNGISTPNLTDRFPVGVGGQEFNYAYGAMGGSDTVTLTTEQMPSHDHGYKTAKTRNYHPNPWMGWNSCDWWQNSTGGNCQKGTTESAGGNQPHENRPPYLAVCFIMRVK